MIRPARLVTAGAFAVAILALVAAWYLGATTAYPHHDPVSAKWRHSVIFGHKKGDD